MRSPLSSTILPTLDYPDAELVIATVSAVGTPDAEVHEVLEAHLRQLGYEPVKVSLSALLPDVIARLKLTTELRSEPEYDRIASHMDAGTLARSIGGEILALCAIEEIAKSRDREPEGSPAAPLNRTVHILRSLKHPDEVAALRRVYGDGFFLVGIHESAEKRLKYLTKEKYMESGKAEFLMKRDEDEGTGHGQKFVKTFHLADFFVRARVAEGPNETRNQVRRFLDLAFGDPHQSPTQDEHAMYLAFASALRSADLSRQIGAVITSATGDVLAVGANDVPTAEGGLYWPGEADRRDHVEGFDSNARQRERIVESVIEACLEHFDQKDAPKGLRTDLVDGPIGDLTEYGRAVHAEMEAILSCARTGNCAKDGTLYSTTFPCHNCAKHIVCTGILRVVFVEPYAKSQARALHSDAIDFDPDEAEAETAGAVNATPRQVRFEHFVGVGPRRYMDLFSMNLSSGVRVQRKSGSAKSEWSPRKNAGPRVPMRPICYLEAEQAAIAQLADHVEKYMARAADEENHDG